MIFRAGKKYALIGRNGAGKSTLAHILCKLYEPQDGNLYLNSIPYSELSRPNIREIVAYISQRPFLFPGTIRDNILIGNPAADESEVISAAEAAGVFAYYGNFSPNMSRSPRHSRSSSFEYIGSRTSSCLNLIAMDTNHEDKMKDILNFEITAHGTNISGGFAQSIALARVFVRSQCSLLILDEAIGQMDSYKKREIILPRLFDFVEKKNMSLVIISHDPHIFESTDYIYMLNDGILAAQGTPKNLIASQSDLYLNLSDRILSSSYSFNSSQFAGHTLFRQESSDSVD